jgi:hypothetical protein
MTELPEKWVHCLVFHIARNIHPRSRLKHIHIVLFIAFHPTDRFRIKRYVSDTQFKESAAKKIKINK